MLLTVKDLQNNLHIGRDRAYGIMKAKGFPAIKIGAKYYVTPEALERWLQKNEGHEVKLE